MEVVSLFVCLHYLFFQMYGQYRKDLGSYAKTIAKKVREKEKPRGFKSYSFGKCGACLSKYSTF